MKLKWILPLLVSSVAVFAENVLFDRTGTLRFGEHKLEFVVFTPKWRGGDRARLNGAGFPNRTMRGRSNASFVHQALRVPRAKFPEDNPADAREAGCFPADSRF